MRIALAIFSMSIVPSLLLGSWCEWIPPKPDIPRPPKPPRPPEPDRPPPPISDDERNYIEKLSEPERNEYLRIKQERNNISNEIDSIKNKSIK